MNANEHAAEIRRGIARALEALIEQTGLGRVAQLRICGHVFGTMTPDGELTEIIDAYGAVLATLRVWFDIDRQCICTESRVLKPIDYDSLN